MRIHFVPGGRLQIDDAQITWKNFAGAGSDYNREGDRNFGIVIDNEEDARRLMDAGWKIKVKEGREEGDPPSYIMPVKVRFNGYGPNIYLVSGTAQIKLHEDEVHRIDRATILSADLDIRPHDWEHARWGTGRTAYLENMRAVQKIDRFASEYNGN